MLYCHAHGGDYTLGKRELTEGARWTSGAPGPAFLAAGFAVYCIDMPGFGARQAEGSEQALALTEGWHGRSLFARMLADQRGAFEHLAAHPRVDPARIFTWGASMGAALGTWLAALEPRVAGAVSLIMLADIAPMIETGAHERHGPWFTAPGLLREADQGDVAACIAPRPFFVAHGGADHLTPQKARDAALAKLPRAGLTTFLQPEAGHGETPEMRAAALAFLARHAHKTDRERHS
ncbi:alpha/beta hydrolase family protein [Vannielia litorea]|uniref:alpha/beta hydrolase family protein n=1 Tax=Vannielia litorea TaxID=1217970 RepID=UPI001BCA82AE|nr:alpha/beta fold hydrolase [Vannielia litorea]